MNTQVAKYIEEHINELVSDLSKLVSINSVRGDKMDDAPFGEGPKKALLKALELGDQYGFTTKNFKNVMGSIDYYSEGEPILSALAHLDVVPPGDGWKTNPFTMMITDGKVYGRGTTDDKGPAICVLYAMRALKACKVKLSHNFRLLVGTDEECGSEDLEMYMKENAMSPMVFTPDADFPVINIEKGRVRASIYRKIKCGGEKTIASAKGGLVANQIPGSSKATVAGFTLQEVQRAAAATGFANNFAFVQEGALINITCTGKNAHASGPRSGLNAVTLIISLLSNLETTDETGKVFKNLSLLFPHGEFDGKSAGIKMSDQKSGELTCALTLLDYACGEIEGTFDIRFPLCGSVEGIRKALTSSFTKYGFSLTKFGGVEPHEVDENTPFVKTLNKVFEDVAGQKGGCIAIGGGTYVHNIEGGVAFGAEYKGENYNIHGANEFTIIDRLKLNTKIYAEAITRLCK